MKYTFWLMNFSEIKTKQKDWFNRVIFLLFYCFIRP